MKKCAILGFTCLLAGGCYAEPPVSAPAYPHGYGYAFNRNYQPSRPYAPGYYRDESVPAPRELQTDPQPDPGDTARSPDMEEVIGDDEPLVDRSLRHASPRPAVGRHRDHSGDLKP